MDGEEAGCSGATASGLEGGGGHCGWWVNPEPLWL